MISILPRRAASLLWREPEGLWSNPATPDISDRDANSERRASMASRLHIRHATRPCRGSAQGCRWCGAVGPWTLLFDQFLP